MKPKVYQYRIKEYNGEQEYTQLGLFVSTSKAEATRYARGLAAHWYDDMRQTDKNQWELVFGGIIVVFEGVEEMPSLLIQDQVHGGSSVFHLVAMERDPDELSSLRASILDLIEGELVRYEQGEKNDMTLLLREVAIFNKIVKVLTPESLLAYKDHQKL